MPASVQKQNSEQRRLFNDMDARERVLARSIRTELDLAALCLSLIANRDDLSGSERTLAKAAVGVNVRSSDAAAARHDILHGRDPLGEVFLSLRSPARRRSSGAVYTPSAIVDSMIHWLSSQGTPARIVDPGAGSGRFLLAAGEKFANAQLIGVELDPLAALMLRANLDIRGWSLRSTVIVEDYRGLKLPRCPGTTAFVGNPPYVRHHDIGETWKKWYATRFSEFGIKASALAGLHLYFFLQTRLLANEGDIGAFITSAEWLDVNYGSALRRLLIDELGGLVLHVLEPTTVAFPGTATTAAITCFRVGKTDSPVRVRSVGTLAKLNGLTRGKDVARSQFRAERRWSVIARPAVPHVDGEIELGDLFKVHRGQVTGANHVWIAGDHSACLPERVRIPAVTKAKDLIQAGASLGGSENLRRVVDLPPELTGFSKREQHDINAFLLWAQAQGADQGYIARHRKAWWSVGLKDPAPILCTYMARRPPQFTLNICKARHINIAHGLYPREEISPSELAALVAWLNANIRIAAGRTYAGGLTKFEPKEIERLRIPRLKALTK